MTPFDWEVRIGRLEIGWCREWRGLMMHGYRSCGPLFWRVRRTS